jgi:hypothetical protein
MFEIEKTVVEGRCKFLIKPEIESKQIILLENAGKIKEVLFLIRHLF